MPNYSTIRFTFDDHGDYIHQNDNGFDFAGLTVQEALWKLQERRVAAERSRHPEVRAKAGPIREFEAYLYRKYFDIS